MSKGYFDDDREDRDAYQKTVALCVAAASFVVLIFLVVLYMNTKEKQDKLRREQANVATEQAAKEEFVTQSHNFTSDELDFWKDADLGEHKKHEKDPEGEKTPYNADSDDEDNGVENSNKSESDKKDRSEQDEGEGGLNKELEEEAIEDENHIAVINEDGKKRIYEIMADVKKHEYKLDDNLKDREGIIEYKDSKYESVKGIDLSKYNGDIDWKKVKDDGVSFAMLRLGSRGYESGLIELDDKFVDYAQNANMNDISIGAYFYSQAISEAEAIEEANYIVGAVGSFNIKYPIAIDIENVNKDTARTNNLTIKERTSFVKLFCDTVKGYGFKPIIYASRDMLIAGLDLSELSDYEIWLADYVVPTDFPYDFKMWQYSNKGKVDGINGDVDLDIRFVNNTSETISD